MKKILLVADQQGWVFDRHCHEIKKRLSGNYEFGIAYHRQNIPQLSKDYDLVYVLDPMPMRYPTPDKTIMGLRCQFLYEEHPQGAKGLYEDGFPGRCVSIKDKCSMFHVVNKNQMKAFESVVTDKPLLLTQHGIDENLFYQKNRHNFRRPRNLVVSTSGRRSGNKGFDIVRKSCEELGYTYRSASYGKEQISKDKMPSFYSGVDVHVCMSKSEGLNNPLMEASAVGVPIISTRTGAAEELISDGVNGFLIDRNKDALVEALRKLSDHELRRYMGHNAHWEIQRNWTWEVRIKDFKLMFNQFFNKEVK